MQALTWWRARRRRTRIGLMAAAVFGVLAVKCMLSSPSPREPLDRLWEQHMLAGTAVLLIHDGTTFRTPDLVIARLAWEERNGSVLDAVGTEYGIAVQYRREWCVLGLWRLGGWSLSGGLVRRLDHGAVTIELYGKQVQRVEPFFPPWRFRSDVPGRTDFELFLLRRDKASRAAAIIRRWSFRQEEVEGGQGGLVWGQLRLDPTMKTVTVTITGLKLPFAAQVVLGTGGRE